ncbi:MAG: HNH endonuclease family protein [Verrucomicrobiota bacterium]
MLSQLEKQLSGVDITDEGMTATVEHILPENPGEVGWEHFTSDAHERSYERVGNYSLLERGLNGQQAGNAAFAQKQAVYAKSQYRTSTDLVKITDWTEEAMAKRQAELAKVAKSIWSLTF